MECEESKISVWVYQEEKLVLGLSKRTTCADVVKVLLDDLNAQRSLSAASVSARSTSHCIVEKWRGSERILPKQTKMLRLWVAWGEEQENVQFVLVKTQASLETHGARSAEARVVLSKQSCVIMGFTRSLMGTISPEKQRRIVRKAFKKLEKMTKKKAQAEHRDASSAEKMETLVHLVLSQDHTIHQQVQRIKELDSEIERCEAKVHFDRMNRHGVNYVQDTYLVGASDVPSQEGDKLSVETLVKFEEYVRQCEQVVRLQEELWKQQTLMDHSIVHIQEELNRRWMRRRREELRGKDTERETGESALSVPRTGEDESTENQMILEGERIKSQLEASSYIGLRLSTDLEAIRGDLKVTDEILGAKEEEMRDLMERVISLDTGEGPGSEERCYHTDEGMESALERKSEWVEHTRGLSKSHSGDHHNDDDSDTGLSSLHSQDSDSQPVCESLV